MLLAVCGGCSRGAAPATPPDVGATYIPAASGATTVSGIAYEYVAAPERKQQIVSGFPAIQIGQSREAVRKILGPPDTARPDYTKSFNPQFLGWAYMYRVRMRSNGPNTNDECVEIFFNPQGQVHWAVPSNLTGLTEKGHPGGP